MTYRLKPLAFALAVAAALALAGPAAAQSRDSKLAPDLVRLVANPASAVDYTWAKDLGKGLLVKVVVVANSPDASLTALRQAVLAGGGSIYFTYNAVRAVSAMVPASLLGTLTARSDVQFILPNRATGRSASLLAGASGASAVPRLAGNAAVDGRGVAIAVLDSGIDWDHPSMLDASGKTRVLQVADIVGFMGTQGLNGWASYKDFTNATATYLGYNGSAPSGRSSSGLAPSTDLPDPYGHGTHVASMAAGNGAYQTLDSSGIAPAATLYDVRVLDAKGVGSIANLLAGIDWVMLRAKHKNIRVMNLSLAANSTDSFLVDPLARAARSAVATGIVVVVAAGNAGRNAAGQEVYGNVGSPGNEPSVITVGASNNRETAARSDDGVAGFSSRGPTRGSVTLASGERWYDNVMKPELVAPGNKLLGAVSNLRGKPAPNGNSLASLYPDLMAGAKNRGAAQKLNQELMQLSGTSVAAPVVAGAAALMLQVNPGLTPPLVKAILQYTAQPLPGANLLQQGTGQLNVEGAVRLAQALRTDIGPALAAGTLRAGDNLLAPGKTLPAASSIIAGETIDWSRIAYAGGSHLVSGDALFAYFQPIYDPALTWVRQVAIRNAVSYLPASSVLPANTVPQAIVEGNAASQALLTPQVKLLDSLAGASVGGTASGLFTPTAQLAGQAASGAGRVLSGGFVLGEGFILAEGLSLAQQRLVGSGFVLSEGFVLGEGFVLSEGLTLGSGFVLGEGFVLSEGFVLGEGFVLSESNLDPLGVNNQGLRGER